MHIELHHSFFSPIRGGQETRMHALAQEFINGGHRVTVVAPVDGVSQKDIYESKGIQFLLHQPWRARAPKSLIEPVLYARNLAAFLKNEHDPNPPDLVLCFSYVYAATAKKVWPSSPVGYLAGAAIWDWHSSLHGHRKFPSRMFLYAKQPAALCIERLAMMRAEKIYVEGQMLRQRLLKFHPGSGDRIAILPAPVDTNRFVPCVETRRRFRQELQIAEDTQVILAVGRLDRNKNFGTLIHAASLLADGNWLVLIVGEGWEGDSLRNLSSSLGLGKKVKFLGRRNDIEAVYSGSDIFAHPTVLESYGNVVLEAMATALPCIVSNGRNIGISYDLTDGVDALLVNPNGPHAWATRIELLMKDEQLSRRLGHEARGFCEARPCWKDVAATLVRDLVNSGASRRTK
ncbi:MAG: glycosyltransferase family 4 protein [Candidatus Acidiferrales bacterium]